MLLGSGEDGRSLSTAGADHAGSGSGLDEGLVGWFTGASNVGGGTAGARLDSGINARLLYQNQSDVRWNGLIGGEHTAHDGIWAVATAARAARAKTEYFILKVGSWLISRYCR